jgi:MFS family permease
MLRLGSWPSLGPLGGRHKARGGTVSGGTAFGNRRPMGFAAFLALVMASGPLVTHALAALGPVLVRELNLDATQFGALWFVTFGVAALLTIQGGNFSDTFGPRPLVLGVFTSAGIGLVAAGLGHSYVWLVVAAVGAGVAQAISNPVTNLLVSTSVPTGKQGVALGIKQSGVPIGQFLVGLLLPSVALHAERKVGFLLLAVLAGLGVVLSLVLVSPTSHTQPRTRQHRSAPRMERAVWWVTAYAFAGGFVNQSVNVYAPLYTNQVHGTPVARAGLIVAVIGGLGTVSRLAWGRVGDRLVDPRLALQWVAGLSVVATGTMGLATQVGEVLVWVSAVVFSVSALAAPVLIMLVVVRGVPTGNVGRASGWASAGLYSGFMVGPVVFGALVDFAGGYTVAWTAVTVVASALLVITTLWRRLQPL